MNWLLPLLIAKLVLDFLTVEHGKIKMIYEAIWFVLCCLVAIIIISNAHDRSDIFLAIALMVFAVIWMGIAYIKTKKKSPKEPEELSELSDSQSSKQGNNLLNENNHSKKRKKKS